MIMSGGAAPTAVVCDDRTAMRRTVTSLLDRCGFAVAGQAADFAALQELVRSTLPSVVVVTLPLPGMNGLRAVRALRQDAPGCEIVLVSSFGRLDVAAVEAGATALVPEDDPQALQAVLRSLAARVEPHEVVLIPPQARAQADATAVEPSQAAPAAG